MRLAGRDDDLMHEPGSEPDFNESAYAQFVAPGGAFGGFFRLGNRVNEGHAEMTACVYLPDGQVAFWYTRAPIKDNTAHEAGGLLFQATEPNVSQLVRYEGPVVLLTDPSQVENPKAAFEGNPRTDAVVELQGAAVGPSVLPWDHQGFATAHLEQHMALSGHVRIGSERFPVDGAFGVRDRSWGPRNWHYFSWYRWLTASFGPDLGFALFVTADQSGTRRVQGYVHTGLGDAPQTIVSGEIETDYDARWYTTGLRAILRTDAGSEYDVEGNVGSVIPLRHRRPDHLARITEGITGRRCGDQQGVGLTEYLDIIVDGRPVGADHRVNMS